MKTKQTLKRTHEKKHNEQIKLRFEKGEEEFFKNFSRRDLYLNACHTPEFIEENILINEKQVTIEIYTDKEFVHKTRNGIDFIVQLWDEIGQQWTIYLPFHHGCDTNFDGKELPVTDIEKAITSLVLFGNDGILPCFDILHRIARGIIGKYSMAQAHYVLD